jgi:hypothetical protein
MLAARPVPANAVIETFLSRSAARYLDRAATLNDDEIRELVRIGTSAPLMWMKRPPLARG